MVISTDIFVALIGNLIIKGVFPKDLQPILLHDGYFVRNCFSGFAYLHDKGFILIDFENSHQKKHATFFELILVFEVPLDNWWSL